MTLAAVMVCYLMVGGQAFEAPAGWRISRVESMKPPALDIVGEWCDDNPGLCRHRITMVQIVLRPLEHRPSPVPRMPDCYPL